ncbi:metal ABC transporter solute-binding protein, Zn/Mn family [Bacillus massiliigorillae]|uniref:metal ABC transporter solute-binding protein, Zn/Mn family n=1 Tax=Bacillus massiliigorillae TaxID=1243664 RepID=UPI00039BC6DF|nr:zinc ABC transporter substrate-binding protein [Bacillus massiliigorillae]
MKKSIILSLILLFSVFLSACGNSEKTGEKKEANKDGVSTIYTTVYPIQFLTEQIGGKYVNVQSVYPPGSNEHTYEPSQKDMIDMSDADMLLYIGFNLEGFINKSKSIFEKEDVKVIPVGENSLADHEKEHKDEAIHESNNQEEHSDDDGHNHGDIDPHIWLNPEMMIHMAQEVKKELVSLNPQQEEYFEKNLETVTSKLEELDKQFKDTVDNSKKKPIIVSHSAYGYWEKRYGIEQIAVTGMANSSEPSQKELQKMMKLAKEHDIKYVLFEQNVDSKLTKIIQKEIGAKSLTLNNLSVLTDQNIKDKEDYFSLMEANITTLKKALN